MSPYRVRAKTGEHFDVRGRTMQTLEFTLLGRVGSRERERRRLLGGWIVDR